MDLSFIAEHTPGWATILIGVVLLVIGFVLLIKGADWFVDGAAGVAAKMRIPTLVIGLTVVAFGTSAPELATSISSAASGSTDISIGNVLGSNICNILLILGLSSIVATLPVQKDSLKIDMPVLFGASALFLLFGITDDEIVWWEGLIMFAIIIAYTVFLVWNALRQRKKEGGMSELNDHEVISEAEAADKEEKQSKFNAWYEKMKGKLWFLIILTVVGIGIVVVGSMLAVEGAKMAAYEIGIPENIVGLTVVAIGTSLPELITAGVAAKKGETDIAVGNIIGSNIFNILMVAGLSAIIYPLPFANAAAGTSFLVDGIIALGAALLLGLFVYLPGHQLRRWNGIILFLGAIGYYVYCVLSVVL